MARVLLFSTVAASHNAARLHSSECPLVAAARNSRGRTKVIEDDGGPYLDDVIADLNEREFPVKTCKCLKASK